MNHPTKAQVQVVIDNLLKAAGIADNNCPIAMRKTTINIEHPCGSPMCHGGWYAIAKLEEGRVCESYVDGAIAMAEDLGFEYDDELEDWAGQNPHIWGNENGTAMFCDDSAFTGDEDKSVKSLSEIIEHWRGVQSRLPA